MMKRTLAFSVAALALAACGGNEADTTTTDSAAAVAPATGIDTSAPTTGTTTGVDTTGATTTPVPPMDSMHHRDSTGDTTARPLPPR